MPDEPKLPRGLTTRSAVDATKPLGVQMNKLATVGGANWLVEEQRHAKRLADAMNTSSSATALVADMQKNQKGITEALKTASDIHDRMQKSFIGLDAAVATLHRRDGTFLNSMATATQVFERLDQQSITRVATVAAKYAASFESIRDIAMQIERPWAHTLDNASSLRHLAGLRDLSIAVRAPTRFADSADAMRPFLGDFRVIDVEPVNLPTPESRLAFYERHGLEQGLTDFPDDVFPEILDRVGLPLTPAEADHDDVRSAVAGDERLTPEMRDRKARINAELDTLEVAMRHFIAMTLIKHGGPDWIDKYVPSGIREAWLQKQGQHEGSRIARPQPLHEYSALGDYLEIIRCKRNWGPIFSAVFDRKEDITEAFTRLKVVRNLCYHAGYVYSADELEARCEVTRLLRFVGITSVERRV